MKLQACLSSGSFHAGLGDARQAAMLTLLRGEANELAGDMALCHLAATAQVAAASLLCTLTPPISNLRTPLLEKSASKTF